MESNQQFLQGKVYVPFLEFAVVFGIQNKCDDMSLNMDVTEELIKHWGMDKEELFAQVLENQQKKSPVVIKNLSALINLSMFDTDNSANLYVMTNEEKINGAATILYPDVLKEFAEDNEVDEVYMLPSSIHKWLLVPDKEAEANLKGRLREMIREVNKECVAENEILSNELYIYNRKRNEITMWNNEEE